LSLALGLVVWQASCAPRAQPKAPVAEPRPSAAVKADAAVIDVPARSEFSVALVDALSTRLSTTGQTFRAKAITPLTTAGGGTVVRVGALLTGRVALVEHVPSASLRLKFETIESARGPVALHAMLSDVAPNGGVVVEQPEKNEARWDVVLRGPAGIPVRGASRRGTVRGDIRLTKQAQLRLVLIDPLRVRLDGQR